MLYEENDGFHAFNNDSIFKDKNGKSATKIMFYEDTISPFGSEETGRTINNLVTSLKLIINQNHGKIPNGAIFKKLWGGMLKYYAIIIVIGMIIVSVYFGFKGG